MVCLQLRVSEVVWAMGTFLGGSLVLDYEELPRCGHAARAVQNPNSQDKAVYAAILIHPCSGNPTKLD